MKFFFLFIIMKRLLKFQNASFSVFKNKILILGGGDAASGAASLLTMRHGIKSDHITILDKSQSYVY